MLRNTSSSVGRLTSISLFARGVCPIAMRMLVSCEEDRLSLFLQSFYDIPNIAPSSRIQASGRLVQENQSGIVDQRDRETNALLQSAREGPELLVPLIFQVDQLDKLVRVQLMIVHCAEVVDILSHCQTVYRVEVLRENPYPFPDLSLVRTLADIIVENFGLSP